MTKKTTWVGALLVSLAGAPLLAQVYGAVADFALSGVMRTYASANIGIAVLLVLQGVSLALLGKHQATRRPDSARVFWAVLVWYLLCAAVFSTRAGFLPDAPRGRYSLPAGSRAHTSGCSRRTFSLYGRCGCPPPRRLLCLPDFITDAAAPVTRDRVWPAACGLRLWHPPRSCGPRVWPDKAPRRPGFSASLHWRRHLSSWRCQR